MPSGDAANGDGADRPGIGRIKRCWRVIGPTLLAFVGALLFIEILGPGYFVDAPPSAEKSGTPPIRADEGLVADLKAQVAEAEARIKEHRARSNAAAIAAQQLGELGELNNQLSSARAAQADAHGKASLLKNVLRQGRANEVPDIAKSESMRRIEGWRVALQAQLGRESRTFLWKHPRIKKLKAQLADLGAKWRLAAERDARVYENEARLASARVDDLQRVLEEKSRIAADASAQEAHLRELERAAKLVKEQLEAETAKDREAFARERQSPSAAGIVQRAIAPLFPASPRETVIIGLATLAAFILAIGAIELLGGASKNLAPAQTRELKFEATSQEDVNAAKGSARSPDSAEEAPHLTRVACVKVLVAPCDANQKSQDAAIALGRNLAHRGRALLIAADRALTRIDALASPDGASKGLADLLIEEISYSDAIYRDAGSHLHVVPGGVGDSEESGDASESQDELESAINALAHAYDFLVVAGSPETARRLAPLIDLAFVIGGAEAENLRAELARAGADAFLLEEGVNADDLIAAE